MKKIFLLAGAAISLALSSCSVGVSAGVGTKKSCCGSTACESCVSCKCSPESIKSGKCACKKP